MSLLAAESGGDQAASHPSQSVVARNVNYYTTMRRPGLEDGPAKATAAPALRWCL